MKIIAFLLLICITAATLLDSSQALRRIKRSLPPLANATKVAQDFVELQTREKDNEANLKEEHRMNAPAAETVVDFKEGNKPNSNEFTSNNKREQHQQLVNNNNNNNEKHFGPKQEQRSLHLGNSALAYLLQNKANRKLNGMPQLFAPIDGAVNVRGSHPAESVLISSGKGRSAFRDMRGSIACNAKKIADLSISNNNGNGNEYSNNDNANKCGGFNDNNNNNNNFDVGNNNNNNNNMKMSAFESSNYNKNNNYDSDGKTLTGVDQLQLENPMHDQQPESATCAAPPQQQQQQPNDQQEKQQQNSGQGPGQGSVVLSIPHTGTAKPEGNMKNIGSHNNRYEPMENVLKLANILLYKLVDKLRTKSGIYNLPPFRTGGTQIFLSPNGNSLPVALPDTEDFDSIDYLYNNPLENNVNNQHSPIATVTTSPVPISVPLLPPLFFQSQFALHEPSAQPMNLIETALDKLLTNGAMESEDSDGDELELRCPIHHDAIKRNGTKGNVKDDIIQVCSCRFFKKKKNT